MSARESTGDQRRGGKSKKEQGSIKKGKARKGYKEQWEKEQTRDSYVRNIQNNESKVNI